MAQQIGFINLRGTIGEVCFYKLEDNYYARQKSCLCGNRVKTDPAFAETMRYAGLFAKASVIGSAAYRMLEKEKRERKIYNALTGEAMELLRNGVALETVQLELMKKVEQWK